MRLRDLVLPAIAVIAVNGLASKAQAGPLIDWLFRGRQTQPSYPVGTPIPLGGSPMANSNYAGYPNYGFPGVAYPGTAYPGAGYQNLAPVAPSYAQGSYAAGYGAVAANPTAGYAANLGTYYGTNLPVIGPQGAGYSTTLPNGITAATLPQSAMPQTPMQPAFAPQTFSYVPNFNSNALRAPVTYYRPLLTTDPNTGAQVVAMAPCTSYQYLTQRVPALGQSALYGSYQAPQPITLPTMPSYTLPSGGIPLASNSAVPQSSLMAPGVYPQTTTSIPQSTIGLGYSPYTTYSVSPIAPQIAPSTSTPYSTGYPTVPLGSSYSAPVNQSPSGGSAGSFIPQSPAYSQSVPGLIAPPASSYPLNSPQTMQQDSGSNQFDAPPSLPPNNSLRPRLRSITPEAAPSGSESAQRQPASERSMLDHSNRELPITNPIPAPEGVEKPSWSPSLLRNEDMTAMRPVNPRKPATGPTNAAGSQVSSSHLLAGQSKKIRWASFEESHSHSAQPVVNPSLAQPSSHETRSVQGPAMVPLSQSLQLVDPSETGRRSETSTTNRPALGSSNSSLKAVSPPTSSGSASGYEYGNWRSSTK